MIESNSLPWAFPFEGEEINKLLTVLITAKNETYLSFGKIRFSVKLSVGEESLYSSYTIHSFVHHFIFPPA